MESCGAAETSLFFVVITVRKSDVLWQVNCVRKGRWQSSLFCWMKIL